jgi:hypothetical protein
MSLLMADATKDKPYQQNPVNTNLVMYTKEYCTDQLLRSLREPISQYFDFLYECAKDDAVKDEREGKMKLLVKFQHRVNKIHSYKDDKLLRILDAFQKDNSFPLNTLLKTILLSNAIIIGSFGQENVESHNIQVPSDRQFIHELLKVIGRTYYNDPCGALRIDGKTKEFDVIKDGLERTIQKLVPFEQLMKPIRERTDFRTQSGIDADRMTTSLMAQADVMDSEQLLSSVKQHLAGSHLPHARPTQKYQTLPDTVFPQSTLDEYRAATRQPSRAPAMQDTSFDGLQNTYASDGEGYATDRSDHLGFTT